MLKRRTTPKHLSVCAAATSSPAEPNPRGKRDAPSTSELIPDLPSSAGGDQRSLAGTPRSETLASLAHTPGKSSQSVKKSLPWFTFDDTDAAGIYWQELRPGQFKLRWRYPDKQWGHFQEGLTSYEAALQKAKLLRAEIDAAEAVERKKSIYQKLGKEQRIQIEPMRIAWRSLADDGLYKQFGITREKLDNPGDLSAKEEETHRRLKDGLRDVRQRSNAIAKIVKELGLTYFDELNAVKLREIVRFHAGEEESPYGYRVIEFLKRLVRYVVVDLGLHIPNAVQILEHETKTWKVRPFRYLEPQTVQFILGFFRLPEICHEFRGDRPNLSENNSANRPAVLSVFERRMRLAICPIVELMRKYALRPKEMGLLNVGDWDPNTKILTIRRKNRKTRKAAGSDGDRAFPVDQRMADILTLCAGGRHPDEPLFRTVRTARRGRGRWNEGYLSRVYSQALKRAGLKSTLYDLRHTAATNIYYYYSFKGENGIQMAKAILGHAEFSTAYRNYIHLIKNRKDLQQIADDYTRSETFYLENLDNHTAVDLGNIRLKEGHDEGDLR